MKKTPVPIGMAINKNKMAKPIIDFHQSFKVCTQFILENNLMRTRQLKELENQGYDLKTKRKNMSRKEYEIWLAEQGVYPKLSGSIETTLEKLISFFMVEFTKGKVRINNQIRFTYSYFQQYYNKQYRDALHRLCITTIKNHFNKISQALKSVFQDKYRGQLCLPASNTNCVVLTFAENVIRFKNDNHTKLFSSNEPRLPKVLPQANQSFLDSIQPEINKVVENLQPQYNRKGHIEGLGNLIATFFQ